MAQQHSLVEKWAPILEHAEMPEIKDGHRRVARSSRFGQKNRLFNPQSRWI